MADWRQIQARIRKAKASTNASEQLSELYERTRDAMVAFELGRAFEKAGDNTEAVKWYTTAAEHFRRAQWRVKAEEALTRLGAPIPPPIVPSTAAGEAFSAAPASDDSPESRASVSRDESDAFETIPRQPSLVPAAPQHAAEDAAEGPSLAVGPYEADSLDVDHPAGSAPPASADAAGAGRKRRRRGRRGGRNRRREPGAVGDQAAAPGRTSSPIPISGPMSVAPSTPSSPSASARSSASSSTQSSGRSAQRPSTFSPTPAAVPYHPSSRPSSAPPEPASLPDRMRESPSHQPSAAVGQSRARAGEPALASRMAQLESQLRRLLVCPMASLDDAERAPAGPGVFLLSDSDQVTHYYVEACQTLRIGIGNLLRGSRGSKSGGQLKQLMGENLGIAESKVPKYLKDHCAVRWLQLDEGAPELAHFAMAVLRPVVKE